MNPPAESVSASLVKSAAPARTTWPNLLTSLIGRRDLTQAEAAWAMNEIMAGGVSDAQVAGFLVALRAKGETVAELAGLADSMLANARSFPAQVEGLDIVGTGGDRLNTVNISTMAALVCAGAGVPIVKHGNRASSSAAGTADVLERLGVRLDLSVTDVARSVAEVGITFCFAQVFHPSMRFAAPARAALAIPTAFNFLGPLTNPARIQSVAIGASDERMAPLLAGVLAQRGNRGMVFRGDMGLDELSTTGPSTVWEFSDGHLTQSVLDPLDLGIERTTIDKLTGEDAEFNATVVRQVLDGEEGPVRDAVLLNAAAGIIAHSGAVAAVEPTSLVQRMVPALEQARKSVDSGAAAAVLARWVDFTQSAKQKG